MENITQWTVLRTSCLACATMLLLVAGCSNKATNTSDAGGTGAGEAGIEEVTLELAHAGAADSPQQDIADILAQALEEETDGAIAVETFDSGTLGNEQELQGAVVDGAIDITIAGTFSHYAPWAGVLETPVLFRDLDHFSAFAQGDIGQELMSTLGAEVGVKPLFIAPHEGFRYITTASTPIREPADMEGLDLRNPEVPAYDIMAEAVGANPTPLAFDELYLALERGVIDGQHNPLSHVTGQSFYDVQEYLSMVPWGIAPHIVSMSTATWDSLSEAQQEAITASAERAAAEYPDFARTSGQEGVEFLEDKMTVVPADEVDVDAFMEVLREVGLPGLEEAYGEDGMRWVNQITDL